jgi:DNA-binding response OmpR family regulator
LSVRRGACRSRSCGGEVSGLLSGADDYITKPFDAAVLEARLAAVLRRRARRSTPHADAPLPEGYEMVSIAGRGAT